MKKRILSFLLAFVMILGILPAGSLPAFAASTEDEALGEVDIFNGDHEIGYLSINGSVRKQKYTYYNFKSADGYVRETPAYRGIHDSHTLPVIRRNRIDRAAPGGGTMSNRKILYGYQIQRGDLVTVSQEAETVQRITTLYLDGLSYQKISDTLNGDGIPFSEEAPLWNKHKVKRLLENPRYTGADGYPPIIDQEVFDTIQSMIREKTANRTRIEKRLAQQLKEYLRCGSCHGRLLGMGGRNQRRDTLYLRCEHCGIQVTIPDADLLAEVSRQIAEHDAPPQEPYAPSSEVVRLTNAINRGLEHPDKPEDVVALVLQGVSARYNCCSVPTEYDTSNRLTEVDFKHFGRAVSHIVIAEDNSVTIQFK